MPVFMHRGRLLLVTHPPPTTGLQISADTYIPGREKVEAVDHRSDNRHGRLQHEKEAAFV